jgi:hypothetical protein
LGGEVIYRYFIMEHRIIVSKKKIVKKIPKHIILRVSLKEMGLGAEQMEAVSH